MNSDKSLLQFPAKPEAIRGVAAGVAGEGRSFRQVLEELGVTLLELGRVEHRIAAALDAAAGQPRYSRHVADVLERHGLLERHSLGPSAPAAPPSERPSATPHPGFPPTAGVAPPLCDRLSLDRGFSENAKKGGLDSRGGARVQGPAGDVLTIAKLKRARAALEAADRKGRG